MDSVEVGKKIRELRLSENLTLEQLAYSLNIKKNMLSNYELGKSSISADLLTKIADYFGVSLDILTSRNLNIALEEQTTKECCVYARLYSDNLSDKLNRREMIFTISLPDSYIGNGNYFGLKITDDSLNAKNILLGSVVIAKQQSVAHSGDVVIYVHENNRASYGVYSIIEDNIVISPCSTEAFYAPAIFKAGDESFKIIGKITSVICTI